VKSRCLWAGEDPLYIAYHDAEWGTPVHDELRHFEFLVLEGAQAGLSWITILRKRDAYRAAYRGFDPARVARFGARDVERLLGDAGIVRNRAKIEATIALARIYLDLQGSGGFARHLWGFVEGRPIQHARATMRDVPAETEISQALAKDLRARGGNFVGPTIVYAFMQAVGMVNDHLVDCHRHAACRALGDGAPW
jgi:DNA-3-methyladenine glycosylase I